MGTWNFIGSGTREERLLISCALFFAAVPLRFISVRDLENDEKRGRRRRRRKKKSYREKNNFEVLEKREIRPIPTRFILCAELHVAFSRTTSSSKFYKFTESLPLPLPLSLSFSFSFSLFLSLSLSIPTRVGRLPPLSPPPPLGRGIYLK